MTPKEKDLLLRDLCARLPYGLKVKCEKYSFPVTILYSGYIDEVKFIETGGIENICAIKPYLFPLSSMTEEQRQELESLMEVTTVPAWGEILSPTPEYYDWLNKTYFDYRNLIDKNLAIDCTNLNIY